ncbi:COG1361 S-layer family protein [Candidatus Woesearchaeota archaeon]|nr:COG1361 S-layer family protein [Candidatus Woesearchaeota archaeon]
MRRAILGILVLAMICIAGADVFGEGSGTLIGSANMKVTLLNQEPDPVEPGKYVTLRFAVENFGSEIAEEVVFKINPEYPFSIEPGESPEIDVGTMGARQTGDDRVVLKYKLKVDENAVEGVNEIRLSYKTKKSVWATLDPFDINIQTHDAIIAVTDVIQNPGRCSAGRETELSIKIKNYADSMLKDIKLKLELIRYAATATAITYTELPFSTVGSSNEIIVYELKPKEETEVKFNLIADAETAADVYKIPLTISYSDNLGINYSKQNLVTVIVGDKPEILATVDSTTILRAGMKGTATVKFVNKGVGKIKFLDVELLESEQYDIISSPRDYLGNIDSDDYETTDFKIYVKPGESDVKLNVGLKYKDAENRAYDEAMDVPLKLYSSSDIKKYELEKKSNTTGIVIIIVIVVIGLGGYVMYKKKRKKSK